MVTAVVPSKFQDTSSLLIARLSHLNLNLDRLDTWVGPSTEDLILSAEYYTRAPSVGGRCLKTMLSVGRLSWTWTSTRWLWLTNVQLRR